MLSKKYVKLGIILGCLLNEIAAESWSVLQKYILSTGLEV